MQRAIYSTMRRISGYYTAFTGGVFIHDVSRWGSPKALPPVAFPPALSPATFPPHRPPSPPSFFVSPKAEFPPMRPVFLKASSLFTAPVRFLIAHPFSLSRRFLCFSAAFSPGHPRRLRFLRRFAFGVGTVDPRLQAKHRQSNENHHRTRTEEKTALPRKRIAK